MPLRNALIAAACLCLLLPLSGCSEVQAALPSEPEAVVEEATVATPDAPVTGMLGSEIPDGVPVWPEATVVSAEETDGSFTMLLETDESYEDVLTGVGVGFERAGWEVAESAEEASATLLDVSGDGFEGLVTVYRAESVTSIEYLLMPAEEGA